jgi:pimeloyl-ACP methyl ester carboxylesterase
MTTGSLVFVHDACLGPWTWTEHFVPFFESLGWRCLAPDLHDAWPGAPDGNRPHLPDGDRPHVPDGDRPHLPDGDLRRGRGGWRRANRVRLADYVAHLARATVAIPSPYVLVGHGMGGAIVQALLALAPPALAPPAGAVLIASPLAGDWRSDTLRWLARWPLHSARAIALRRVSDLLRPAAQARAALFHAGTPDHDVSRFARAVRDESFAAWLDTGRVRLDPGALRVPVLVLGGREDACVSVRSVRRAATAWRAQCHVVPHAGHCIMLEAGWLTAARHIQRWLTPEPR